MTAATTILGALIAAALLLTTIGLGLYAVRAPFRTRLRCDDPANDPHARAYGEMPGFSDAEIDQFEQKGTRW
jgi:hypothetical protein